MEVSPLSSISSHAPSPPHPLSLPSTALSHSPSPSPLLTFLPALLPSHLSLSFCSTGSEAPELSALLSDLSSSLGELKGKILPLIEQVGRRGWEEGGGRMGSWLLRGGG